MTRRTYDIAVIGGGVAGSLSVLNAVNRGCSVAWVRPNEDPAAQSFHWHGYLHRGHLYDPAREVGLIADLRISNEFWDNLRFKPYKDENLPWIVRSQQHNAAFGELLPSEAPKGVSGFGWVQSNENLFEGARFLADLRSSVRLNADTYAGLCVGHVFVDREHKLLIEINGTDVEGAHTQSIYSRRVVVATGFTNPDWLPSRKHRVRLGRMLVLSGEQLPNLSFICPGESHLNGLFAVNKYSKTNQTNTWLVSDRFSSSAVQVEHQDLLGGWWARSVALRLQKLMGKEIFHNVNAGAYNALKSSIRGDGHDVSSTHFSVDNQHAAHLYPSKWTVTPLASVQMMDHLFGVRKSDYRSEFDSMANIVTSSSTGSPMPELWQTTPTLVPAARLTERSRSSFIDSASMFRHHKNILERE